MDRRKREHEIEELADDQGHAVLFTPPHHTYLQPIDLGCELV